MAGFEVIVRPVVFPSIRPAPARSLAPEDDPEQGVAVLSGSSGKLIDLPMNTSVSWTRSLKYEKMRVSKPVRVKQKEKDGTINPDNYVDTKRLKALQTRDGQEDTYQVFHLPKLGDNEEAIGPDITETNEGDEGDVGGEGDTDERL